MRSILPISTLDLPLKLLAFQSDVVTTRSVIYRYYLKFTFLSKHMTQNGTYYQIWKEILCHFH